MSEIIRTWSGEEISLAEASEEQLVSLEVEAREFKARMDDTRALLREELVRRMDRRGVWTMRAGDQVVRAPSPEAANEKVYDTEYVAAELQSLVDAGECEPSLIEQVITTTVSRKIGAGGARTMRALGGRYAEIIEEATSLREKPRNLTLKRS